MVGERKLGDEPFKVWKFPDLTKKFHFWFVTGCPFVCYTLKIYLIRVLVYKTLYIMLYNYEISIQIHVIAL
jgi:hypothetical protein